MNHYCRNLMKGWVDLRNSKKTLIAFTKFSYTSKSNPDSNTHNKQKTVKHACIYSHVSIHTYIHIYPYTYMRICIYKYVYVCIHMNGWMDTWVCTYNPKATYIRKYNPKILNTSICVSFMLSTPARLHTRTHTHTHKSTRVHMNAYIHMHNHTNTVV